MQVRGRHVDLRPQYVFAVGEFARAHAPEQVQVLLDTAVAVRAVRARLRQRAAVGANLLRAQGIDVRQPHLDELLGRLVQRVEVIRSMGQPVAPVEAEPVHVLLDGVDVLLVFLVRVGVVVAQVGSAARLFGNAEIEADRHDVADMQVAVRFRRKPRDDFGVLPGLEIVVDDLADKIPRRFAHRFNSLLWTGRYCTRSRRPA